MLAGVQGTTIVLDAARHAGVRRVVFAAAPSAYGDTPELPKIETMAPRPLSPYAVEKLAGEHLLRVFAELYGIETREPSLLQRLRPAPGSERASTPRSSPNFSPPRSGASGPSSSATASRRATSASSTTWSSANLLAAERRRTLRGAVVNVACGERTSLNQLLAYVGEEASVKLEPEYRPARAGDVRDSVADIGAARRTIGYEPAVDIRTGLRLTFEALARATR